MNESLFMIIALLTGVVLGSIFFGGLWFTVRKAVGSKIPALWFLGSFLVRTGIVLTGFYAIMQRVNWLDGLICLMGFIAARLIIIRLTKAHDENAGRVKKEVKEAVHEA
jgi:F1F0 ATPase subunit 2